MATWQGLLLSLSVGLIAGCADPLTAPPCTAMPFVQASVSGDTITTTTGLRYIEGAPGTGGALPWCRSVAVHYTGYLLDGFEQGVIGMHTCGTRRLIIPPELAYGADPRRNEAGDIIIPANSTVVFDVQVLEIPGEPFTPCDEPNA